MATERLHDTTWYAGHMTLQVLLGIVVFLTELRAKREGRIEKNHIKGPNAFQ